MAYPEGKDFREIQVFLADLVQLDSLEHLDYRDHLVM